MDVMKRIRELIELKGYTLYRLSKECNTSYSTFTHAEERNGQLSIDVIKRVCDAFGISLAEFFAGKDEKVIRV